MAKTEGYTCDREGCDTFAASKDADPPVGWLSVVIAAEVPREPRPGELPKEKRLTKKDFCCDRCVVIFCTDRHEAAGGKRIIRPNPNPKTRSDKGKSRAKGKDEAA